MSQSLGVFLVAVIALVAIGVVVLAARRKHPKKIQVGPALPPVSSYDQPFNYEAELLETARGGTDPD